MKREKKSWLVGYDIPPERTLHFTNVSAISADRARDSFYVRHCNGERIRSIQLDEKEKL